jgi:branched-chain amino acid transport system substrate-binding protein
MSASLRIPLIAGLMALAAAGANAETIRIAHIDPFSGPAAGINQNNANVLQYTADLVNREHLAGADRRFEMVDFDNKGTPQESLAQLQNAIDQGIRYIVQGLSSSVGLAMTEAVNRYNERNPGKEVIYLNPTNAAPEMTNEKCSFWAFRFDSNQDMKVDALAAALAGDKQVRKVYLINQNYPTGQQTSAAARAVLKKLRPDIEIVGDDLHPMLAVKDFSPYVAKIKASGADAVLTANWSLDLSLLIKAARESNLQVQFWTVNGATSGVPTALAASGAGNVKIVTHWVPNDDLAAAHKLVDPFKAKYNDDFTNLTWFTSLRMLAEAMKTADSSAPVTVARTLEGLKMDSINGTVTMRKSDHQIQQHQVIADWRKTNGSDVVYDLEKTGYGFKTVQVIGAEDSELPTTCQMKRPG